MRRIAQPPCPPVLDGPSSQGGAEIVEATTYYGSVPRPEKGYLHTAYKHQSVRDRLNEAFGYRCAYCESSYGATQPVDVEHYRPKGEIATSNGTIKPGYFWLAATWCNLLPSCIDCNRVRYHRGRDGVPRRSGKGNWFPLVDERQRVVTPDGDISTEQPLLLNPYHDHPERHLEALEEGALRPAAAPGEPGGEDARGRATIDVIGLNRPQLVTAREAYAVRVKAQLRRVADAEDNIRRHPDDQNLYHQLRRELNELKELKKPSSPYRLLTEHLIAAHRDQRHRL